MGAVQLALMLAPSLVSGPDPREDLALLMEPGVMVPPGLAALAAPPSDKHSRKGSTDSDGSKASKHGSSPETSPQPLPPPGQAPQTLVGVLEIWIKNLPALHGKDKCECALVGAATSPVTPLAGQQHALLNNQSAAARAPPVATASP